MDFENNTNNGDNTGVVIDIQKINCYIEDQFNKMDTSMKNKIELIHPQINFYYNSFNLCIGKQGCGKTTLIIKELYKLCTLPQNALYDTFIYVASGNDDETFNTLANVQYAAPTAEPIIAAQNGYFNFKLTPNIAGSVIPNIADIPDVSATLFNFSFLVTNIDPNAAAPWATLLQAATANKNEPPVTAVFANNCISIGNKL